MKQIILSLLGLGLSALVWGFELTPEQAVAWLEHRLSYKELVGLGLSLLVLNTTIIVVLCLKICDSKKALTLLQAQLPVGNMLSDTPFAHTSQFTLIHGIYYKDDHAFCPVCCVPMTQHSQFGYDEHHYHCPKCQKYFAIDANYKPPMDLPL